MLAAAKLDLTSQEMRAWPIQHLSSTLRNSVLAAPKVHLYIIKRTTQSGHMHHLACVAQHWRACNLKLLAFEQFQLVNGAE